MSLQYAEELTKSFYKWEQRGRGWNLWNFPVYLEPPFVPFHFHISSFTTPIDDGRKPTFLSTIAEKVKKTFNNSSEVEPVEFSEGMKQVEAIPFPNIGEIREISVVLPKGYKTIPEYFNQLILSISLKTSVIGFEIIGSKESIVVQFSCRASSTAYLKQQVKAFFPESIVNDNENSLHAILSEETQGQIEIVDFGLSEEFMRPIRIYDTFSPDPLTSLFGVLDNLNDKDIAILQVLFQEVSSPWSESILRAVTNYDGSSFFADAPEMLNLAREKCKYPLFAVNVRIVGKSTNHQRSWNIIESLASCLSVFADPQSNELIPLSNDSYDKTLHIEDVVLRQTHRSGMILNLFELNSLIHFPSNSVVTNKLGNKIQKSQESPIYLTGNEFVLGENVHQGKTNIVSLNHEHRLRHMHIIGATGTGKSTLLLNLLVQDIEKGLGIALIDPHGDLIDSVLERIPQDRFDDVVLFDGGDDEKPIGFNILEAQSEIEKNVLSSDLVEIFKRFSTSWGDQMSVVLGNAISAFLECERKGSLLDLRRFLIESEYRNEILRYVRDENIKYFWNNEFNLLKRAGIGSILTRLDFFLRSKLIRNIVGQNEGINLENIINTKKVLLVKLSQGIIGEENSYLLGSLLVSKLHQAVMQRQLKGSQERDPFYLYIDEFQNFITPSMKAILSGARKYHLGLILAHQDLHQLKDTDSGLTNSLITNAGIRVCFRVGDFDAQKLEEGFAHFGGSDLQNLSTGEAVVRVNRSDDDFNIRTTLAPNIESSVALSTKLQVTEISRNKYGKPIISDKKELIDQRDYSPLATSQIEKVLVNEKQDNVPSSKEKKYSEKQNNVSYHRYLQSLIKRMAEQRGYKATIEEPTSDGLGRVDVGFEKDGEKIACEISVTTSVDHEIDNIKKCLKNGYSKVLVCVQNKKTVEDLKSIVVSEINVTSRENIFILLPDEVLVFFESLGIKESDSNAQTKVKGYRVKLKYNMVSEIQKKHKQETINEIISQSLKRIKK